MGNTTDKRRFVVQEHERAGNVHWDLMLESGPVLLTWRVDAHPANIGGQGAKAMRIADHDLKFLSYEGPVNKGQGKVRIADGGTFEIISESGERFEIELYGKILKGRFVIGKIEGNIVRS